MGKGNNPFGGMSMSNMMGLAKQVEKMMADQKKAEEELAELRVEASSGGGMVVAVANGRGEVLDIKISKEVVDPDDVEMLQDLIVSAVREAIEKGLAVKEERLSEITGGMNLPNIPGLF